MNSLEFGSRHTRKAALQHPSRGPKAMAVLETERLERPEEGVKAVEAPPLTWRMALCAWLVWPAICALPLALTRGETAYRWVFPAGWYDEVPVRSELGSYLVTDPRTVKPLGLILGLSAVVVGQFFMLWYHYLRRTSMLGSVTRVQPQALRVHLKWNGMADPGVPLLRGPQDAPGQP